MKKAQLANRLILMFLVAVVMGGCLALWVPIVAGVFFGGIQ